MKGNLVTVDTPQGPVQVEAVELLPMAKMAFQQFQERVARESQALMLQASKDLALDGNWTCDVERQVFWRPAPPPPAGETPPPPLPRAERRRRAKAATRSVAKKS